MKAYPGKCSVWFLVTIALGVCMSACGPNAEKVIQNYESHSKVTPVMNKAGISVSINAMGVAVEYANPLLNGNMEYVEKLGERLFVADAINPSEILDIKWGMITKTSTVNGVAQPTTYQNFFSPKDLKAKFLIVGFKGIEDQESKDLVTSPLFFIIEPKAKENQILTPEPLLSDQLFDTDFERTRFAVYSVTLKRKTFPGGDEDYTIRIGEIGTDKESGNTYVEFLSDAVDSNDWGNMDMGYNHGTLGVVYFYAPFLSEIIVNGKLVRVSNNIASTGVGIREIYKTKMLPDTIILRANDRNGVYYSFGEALVFDGKTKEFIRKENF